MKTPESSSTTPTQDPRFKNQAFSKTSAATYMQEYAAALHHTLTQLDKSAIDEAAGILQSAMRDGRKVFVAGNGGSAAISDHLCCDWTKGTRVEGLPSLKTQSLVSNVALLTAIANDYGHENCFSAQLEMLADRGDVLVLISSSGNSPNILRAAEAARAQGVQTVGFTGFSGGKLGSLVDVHLHANFSNYGLVEDVHQILMHVLAQFIALCRDQAQDKDSDVTRGKSAPLEQVSSH